MRTRENWARPGRWDKRKWVKLLLRIGGPMTKAGMLEHTPEASWRSGFGSAKSGGPLGNWVQQQAYGKRERDGEGEIEGEREEPTDRQEFGGQYPGLLKGTFGRKFTLDIHMIHSVPSFVEWKWHYFLLHIAPACLKTASTLKVQR